MENFHPIRRAWAEKKSELGLLKRQIMSILDISTDVQFYDFINGSRKNITPEQQNKIADLFNRQPSELFPSETIFE